MRQKSNMRHAISIPLSLIVGYSTFVLYNNATNMDYKKNYVAADDFRNDRDEVLFARLIYGEARGESIEVKRAIADSVLNRAKKRKWFGDTLREIILKQKQYSCFNEDDVNLKLIKDPLKYENARVWNECLSVARETLRKDNADQSNGATHYYDNSIPKPKWAKNKSPVLTLSKRNKGKVIFYHLEH